MNTKSTVPFHRVMLDGEDIAAVAQTLEKGWLTVGGIVSAFEQDFATFISSTEAIATSSGSTALDLLIRAHGIGPGDEVIVPSLTFTSTAAAVLHAGATPVFADVDQDTLSLDPAAVHRAVTSRTRAVLVVDYAGVAFDIPNLRQILPNDVLIFEDAAHALPSYFGTAHAGTLADGAAFSFYATKTVTSGEGGMLIVKDDEARDRARLLSMHGMPNRSKDRYSNGGWRYDVETPGYKYTMADPNAALGRRQLAKAKEHAALRNDIAQRYDEMFRDHPRLRLPFRRGGNRDSWHLYPLRIEGLHRESERDMIVDQLRSEGIGVNVHFIPLHTMTAYQALAPAAAKLQITSQEASKLITLPIWPGMSPDQVQLVANALIKEIER